MQLGNSERSNAKDFQRLYGMVASDSTPDCFDAATETAAIYDKSWGTSHDGKRYKVKQTPL